MSRSIFMLLAAGLLEAATVNRLGGLLKERQLTVCEDPVNFLCADGLSCVEPHHICNTFADCEDNSDETLPQCPPPDSCTGPNRFPCRNGAGCLPITFRCNLVENCDDGSDEENCEPSSCTEEVVKCDNGLCIHPTWLCDGDDDCGNGWDERPENCSLNLTSQATA